MTNEDHTELAPMIGNDIAYLHCYSVNNLYNIAENEKIDESNKRFLKKKNNVAKNNLKGTLKTSDI